MVVTRSQSRQSGHPPPMARGGNSNNNSHNRKSSENDDVSSVASEIPREATQERLGRGCRIPRPPPPSYDSIYVAKTLLPTGRRQTSSEDLQINSRYPERDGARRAVVKMRSTIHSLDEDSKGWMKDSEEEEDDDDGNDDVDYRQHGGGGEEEGGESGADDSGEGGGCCGNGGVSSQAFGRRRGRGRCRVLPYKREREQSIDSSITNESMREKPNGQGGEDSLGLLVERSASVSSSVEYMSDGEVRHAYKKAKESRGKNIPINHYLNDVIKGLVDSGKSKSLKRRDERYRRRKDDIFLGLNGTRDAPRRVEKDEGDGCAKGEIPAPLGDITPLHIDTSISFEKVGGLSGHVVLLREMVLFPLLYPEVLRTMNLTPPRGVLFVGPPGTGKTLMARALANEGARCAQRKITFFMRKGADILSKWVGESERQLGLLFEAARRHQPSIIFFDEMDGLVPIRHTKIEQSQAALVSTLLALIDGLDDRGQVIVIGATNRPDAIDPALRRPGRFDRELYFPLPDAAARRHILDIVTQPMLSKEHPMREAILEELTGRCEGWSGAEIQALCTEAGLNRLRTAIPQIYTTSKKLQIPVSALTIQKEDFFMAIHRVKSFVRRGTDCFVTSLDEHLEHLLYGTRREMLSRVAAVWPSASAALDRERRNCSDACEAVQELRRFPIPHTAHPLLFFLTVSLETGASSRESSEFALEKVAVALIKALPSIRSFTVHLPHLVVEQGSAAMMVSGTAASSHTGTTTSCWEPIGQESMTTSYGCSFDGGHIYSLIMAVQRTTGPSLVLLQGFDAWLEEYGAAAAGTAADNNVGVERKKHVEDLCYYLNLLRDSDVLIVAPTLHKDITSLLFGDCFLSAQLGRAEFIVPCAPTEEDLRRFLQYIVTVVDLALSHSLPAAWTELPDDLSPPPPPSIEEVRAARHSVLELWRRVEYRRRQLNYVLAKWVSQYVSSRKFSLFLSADLDLTPGHSLYEKWQKHTSGRRIGLCDVMEKLENVEYTCLSQYHDDIDMLVHNVRTFFRTCSVVNQRYRSRVLELKEMTVLNLYKINRNVVHFCELHKDLAEPDALLVSSSDSSHDSMKQTPRKNATAKVTIAGRAKSTRKPAYRFFGTRRRRKRCIAARKDESAVMKRPTKEEGVDVKGESEVVERAGEEGVIVATPMGQKQETFAFNNTTTSNNNNNECLERSGVDRSEMNGVMQPSGSLEEIDVLVHQLAGLSFLHLHRVFQVSMRILEEEIGRRRKQQKEQKQGGGSVHAEGVYTEASFEGAASFFQRMVHEAVHKVV